MNWNQILNKYLHEESDVSEIAANGPGKIFIKQKGIRKEIILTEESTEAYTRDVEEQLIERFGLTGERFIAEGLAVLRTGERARVHITLPPACDFPYVTIAKKTETLKTLRDLRDVGSFNKDIYNFLVGAVKANLSIVISGGTGSGKTTLMEALSKEIREEERIGVCEDSPELQLKQKNTIYLHSTVWSPGMDINEVATLSWCVQQLNRQRVDRILVGETRGKEFADFIVAANSGCEGSMTTIHANDVKSATRKMANFVTQQGFLEVSQANGNIAETIDLIVQIGKNMNGQHRIMNISEVTEQPAVDETIITNTLFTYDNETDDWNRSHATDKLREKMRVKGFDTVHLRAISSDNENISTTIPRGPLDRFQRGGS